MMDTLDEALLLIKSWRDDIIQRKTMYGRSMDEPMTEAFACENIRRRLIELYLSGHDDVVPSEEARSYRDTLISLRKQTDNPVHVEMYDAMINTVSDIICLLTSRDM